MFRGCAAERGLPWPSSFACRGSHTLCWDPVRHWPLKGSWGAQHPRMPICGTLCSPRFVADEYIWGNMFLGCSQERPIRNDGRSRENSASCRQTSRPALWVFSFMPLSHWSPMITLGGLGSKGEEELRALSTWCLPDRDNFSPSASQPWGADASHTAQVAAQTG